MIRYIDISGGGGGGGRLINVELPGHIGPECVGLKHHDVAWKIAEFC